ncbi:hypothetical protein AAG570_009376, partial [Ranatra chinensis]
SFTGQPKSLLDGIPLAVKDNFCAEGITTTCGSSMLKHFVPTYTATVVERLLDAGALLIGKCNLDEFAMGSGTVDSIHGPTKNIWNSNIRYTRIAGGSSGGCAVAVASGSCFVALGSDTGGSTRNPASYCGVVGLKPTYSSVSRYGLIPLVNSMDVPGILTRTVEDAAIVYNIISGPDIKDSTTVPGIKKVSLTPEYNPQKIKIGIPLEYFCEGISDEVIETCELVMHILKQGGADLSMVSLPHTGYSVACYSVLNQCEVASNMARYDGLRYGYRANECTSTNKLYSETRKGGFNYVVRGRILAGNFFLLQKNYQQYFEKALQVRRLISNDFKRAWEKVDILLTPTTPSEAPLFDEFLKLDNRAQCSIQDYCTQPANMAGCPAVSLPIKLSKNGMPLSIQLMAPNYNEQGLLSIAQWIEHQVCFPTLKICL